ncbi:esterase-like activity of phytase family protein [Saccharopolyspora griseoalba]|uniref:Esterase-like activity of phytase family protein n=1 Tax=Saccharopolyspora griseoalba TaxID=1431848 RepID=A0ABW2LJ60_9PSEU
MVKTPRALAVAALLAIATAPAAPAAPPQRVELVGETTLPHAMRFEGTTVGGLSGIDHDPATGEYLLISDDRSDQQPARTYTGRFDRGGQFRLTGTHPLLRPDGSPYPPGSVDPEDVRHDPWTGRAWWTSEGERGSRLIDPAIRETDDEGAFTGEIPVADNLRMAPGSGPRNNLALEGLTFAAGGSLLVTAMEGPLLQDGDPPTTERGALSRLTVQDRAGEVLGQYAYPLDPVFAESPTGGSGDNGVSAILADDRGRYLVAERAYVAGVGNSIRVYEADLRGATDVEHVGSLVGSDVRPVRKRLLADLAEFDLGAVDNVEGMTWGPRLADGRRTLVLVSDDNFSESQTTQLITLAVG